MNDEGFYDFSAQPGGAPAEKAPTKSSSGVDQGFYDFEAATGGKPEESFLKRSVKSSIGGAAWLADQALGVPGQLIQGGAYSALRAIGATVPKSQITSQDRGDSEEAAKLSAQIAPSFTFFEDLAAKAGLGGPGEAISGAVEKGADWLAKKTGTKKEDIEEAVGTFMSATGAKAGSASIKAAVEKYGPKPKPTEGPIPQPAAMPPAGHPEMSPGAKRGAGPLERIEAEHLGKNLSVDELAEQRVALEKAFKDKTNRARADILLAQAERQAGLDRQAAAKPEKTADEILAGLRGDEEGMVELKGGQPASGGFSSEELRILKKPAFERTSEERIRLRALQAGKVAAVVGASAVAYEMADDDHKEILAAIPALAYTTRTLDALPKEGMISKGQIRETLKRQSPRKEEIELFTEVLDSFPPTARVDAAEFAHRVRSKLLTLSLDKSSSYASYGINELPSLTGEPISRRGMGGEQLRVAGPDKLSNKTHVWKMETPIQQNNHFDEPRYFGHTREVTVRDAAPIRHIVEVQSDLMQRRDEPLSAADKEDIVQEIVKRQGNLDAAKEATNRQELEEIADDIGFPVPGKNFKQEKAALVQALELELLELRNKLSPQGPPKRAAAVGSKWYELLLREEHRQAAKEGIRHMRLAAAETIAKVERWQRDAPPIFGEDLSRGATDRLKDMFDAFRRVRHDDYSIEQAAKLHGVDEGKLREVWNRYEASLKYPKFIPEHQALFDRYKNGMEPFVKKEFGAKEIVDRDGNKWLQWDVPPEAEFGPVKQLGAAAAIGTGAYLASGEDKDALAAGVVPFFLRKGKLKEAARIAEVLSEATPKALENMIERTLKAEQEGILTHEETLERLHPIRSALWKQRDMEKRGVELARPDDTKPLERATKTSLRDLGLTPRDLGQNPRAQGTNPRGMRGEEGAIDPKTLTGMLALGGAALVGGMTGAAIWDEFTTDKKNRAMNRLEGGIEGAVVGALAVLVAISGKDIRASMKDLGSREFRVNVKRGERAIFQLVSSVTEAVPDQARRAAITTWLNGQKVPLSKVEQAHAQRIKTFFDNLVAQGMDPDAVAQAWRDFNATLDPASPMGKILQREGPLATRDIATVLGVYGNSLIRSLERKRLLAGLKSIAEPSSGNPFAMVTQKAPGYYVPIDHPQMNGWRVHPDIAPGLKFAFDTTNHGALIRGAQVAAESSKRILVSISGFHVKNLVDVVVAASMRFKTPKEIGIGAAGAAAGYALAPDDDKAGGALAGLVAARGAATLWDAATFGHLSMLKNGGVGDAADWALKGDLAITYDKMTAHTIDQTKGFYAGMRSLERAADKVIPGLSAVPRAIREAASLTDRVLWPWVHTGMKLWMFDQTFQDLKLKNAREALKDPTRFKSDEQLARISGSYVNSLFGGLDWMAVAEESTTRWGRDLREGLYNPKARSYLNLGVFAMDWTVSTTRAVTQALPIVGAADKDLRALHLGYVLKGALYYAATADALNYVLSGHHLWQNSDPTMIETEDGRKMVWSKHSVEALHWLMRPVSQGMNKLSAPLKEFVEQSFGVEWLSPKGAPRMSQIAKEKGISEPRERLTHATKTFAPISIESAAEDSGWDWRSLAGMQVFGQTKKQKEERAEKKKQQARDRRDFGARP